METLLIQNFEQFLDALNLCNTGIYTHEEVIQSSAITKDEVADFVLWNTAYPTSNLVMEKDDIVVNMLCFEPGQSLELQGQNSGWLRTVSGKLEISDDEQNSSLLLPGKILEYRANQRLINTQNENCICVQLMNKVQS